MKKRPPFIFNDNNHALLLRFLLVIDLFLIWLDLTFPNQFAFLPLGGNQANQLVSLIIMLVIIFELKNIFKNKF
ncbi:MAG: hypothetical protein COA69_03400 [Robiginitomaculum sp.]|nr:MAG: hypothetical protein COA69_03400 [Robiginitomaculum sp.]